LTLVIPNSKKVKEARRKNSATANPNQRNYARCEWKCMEWIGTDDWEKMYNTAIRRDV